MVFLITIVTIQDNNFRPLLFDEILNGRDEQVRQVDQVDFNDRTEAVTIGGRNVRSGTLTPDFFEPQRIELLGNSAPKIFFDKPLCY